jgi:tRNA(Arg) A34 adenosine deaminase TadA
MDDVDFMTRAIALARSSAGTDRGPFGSVIVRDGKIIGEGVNQVVSNADPTAHAEITAIRSACRATQTHRLTGSTIYTSCEPCPMCLGAIWWARIARIVFGSSRRDAAVIGFDDEALYREVTSPLQNRKLPIFRLMENEALEAFRLWSAHPSKVPY